MTGATTAHTALNTVTMMFQMFIRIGCKVVQTAFQTFMHKSLNHWNLTAKATKMPIKAMTARTIKVNGFSDMMKFRTAIAPETIEIMPAIVLNAMNAATTPAMIGTTVLNPLLILSQFSVIQVNASTAFSASFAMPPMTCVTMF